MLVVTDAGDGLDRGAAINFVRVGARIRFEVSLDAAVRSGLHVKSDLLSVAVRVTAARKEEGLAPRSRSRALVAIRTFHKFLVAERLCAHNPTGQVTAPRSLAALPKTLSPQDVEALRSSLGALESALEEFCGLMEEGVTAV